MSLMEFPLAQHNLDQQYPPWPWKLILRHSNTPMLAVVYTTPKSIMQCLSGKSCITYFIFSKKELSSEKTLFSSENSTNHKIRL